MRAFIQKIKCVFGLHNWHLVQIPLRDRYAEPSFRCRGIGCCAKKELE